MLLPIQLDIFHRGLCISLKESVGLLGFSLKLSPWRGGPNYSFFIFPHFSAQEAKKDVKKEKGNSYHVVTGILENEEQCSIRKF